tara:strand:+ start:74 stop:799 length:726 start_codon:yes stop_codon:yes gene_type:complete
MTHTKEIIKIYQKKDIAKTFDNKRNIYSFQKYKHKIESNFLKKAILGISSKNIKILDIACGTGRMLPEVFSVRKDIEYFGVDSSKEMTNLLKEKAKKINIEKRVKIKIADASKLPFKDNEFDLVYTYHLLWHIPKENQEKIIKEMFRVTKKNGIIIFDVLNKNFIYEKIKKFLKIKKTEGIHKLSISDIKKIIGDKNHKIEKLSDFPIKNSFLYSIFNLKNKFRKILPKNLFHMIFFKIKK